MAGVLIYSCGMAIKTYRAHNFLLLGVVRIIWLRLSRCRPFFLYIYKKKEKKKQCFYYND
jgi:hypothetical protein